MTMHVPIKEAKNRLSELARLVSDGERVIVTRHGKPEFEMILPRKGGVDFEGLRKWKAERGLPDLVVGPMSKDFDDPLPEDFLITSQQSEFFDGSQ